MSLKKKFVENGQRVGVLDQAIGPAEFILLKELNQETVYDYLM